MSDVERDNLGLFVCDSMIISGCQSLCSGGIPVEQQNAPAPWRQERLLEPSQPSIYSTALDAGIGIFKVSFGLNSGLFHFVKHRVDFVDDLLDLYLLRNKVKMCWWTPLSNWQWPVQRVEKLNNTSITLKPLICALLHSTGQWEKVSNAMAEETWLTSKRIWVSLQMW